jgi:hypothetical protein
MPIGCQLRGWRPIASGALFLVNRIGGRADDLREGRLLIPRQRGVLTEAAFARLLLLDRVPTREAVACSAFPGASQGLR